MTGSTENGVCEAGRALVMLLQVVLLLLSPGLGEARRRKELPIDREPGEAGTQQRAKASGEQSICTQEKRFRGLLILVVPWVC